MKRTKREVTIDAIIEGGTTSLLLFAGIAVNHVFFWLLVCLILALGMIHSAKLAFEDAFGEEIRIAGTGNEQK
jgi:hypothetical protein